MMTHADFGSGAAAERRGGSAVVGTRAGGELLPCRGLSIGRVAVYATATVAFLLVNKAGLAGNAAFFLVVGAMMLAGPMPALMGFTGAVLALTANTAFVAKTAVFTFSRVFSVALFSARFVVGGSFTWLASPPFITLTIFCAVAALCSIATGYFTAIALIKVLVFWMGMTGFFAFVATIRERRIDTTEWFVAQTVAIVMLSVLSLALGVAQNFKGEKVMHNMYNMAFYHSQTAGPVFALLIIYLLCVLLFARHRNRWVCLPVLGFLAYGLYLTRSRTGLGTVIVGIVLVTGLALAWGRGRRFAIRLNYPRWTIVAVFLVLAAGAALYEVGTQGGFTAAVVDFLIKSVDNAEEAVVANILSSRSGLIAASLENFRESPVIGIGFGVSKTQYFRENATLFYAPVEKGFLPTALLEEVGVIGTSAFVLFMATMFVGLVRTRNIPGVAMLASLLVLNLGEAGLFALGGHGAYMWLFVMGGILLGDRCTIPVAHRGARAGVATTGAMVATRALPVAAGRFGSAPR